jgi:hypothetical protein
LLSKISFKLVNLYIIFYLFKLVIANLDPIFLSFPPAKSSMFPLFAVWQQHSLLFVF